jgi:hypothetical protein
MIVGHPYFVGVQYHPEYISRPMNPSPPYFGFLLAASGKLQGFVNRGFRKSPHMSYSESEDDEICKIVDNMSINKDCTVESTLAVGSSTGSQQAAGNAAE